MEQAYITYRINVQCIVQAHRKYMPIYRGLKNKQVPCKLTTKLDYTADCGAPPPPVNGFLQPHTNTTEGSVVVFQCDLGFVPEGEMTAVCGSDGQWTPNPGGMTCSPRTELTFIQTFTVAPTQPPTPTETTTPMEPRPGENEMN